MFALLIKIILIFELCECISPFQHNSQDETSQNVIAMFEHPDSHRMRAVQFQINTDHPKWTFAFNGGSFGRHQCGFNVTFDFSVASLRTDSQVIHPKEWLRDIQHLNPHGMLFYLAHPYGIGFRLCFGDQELLNGSNHSLSFEIAPILTISGYQPCNKSVGGDMRFLAPRAFNVRHPHLKPVWIGIEIQIGGKSVINDQWHWVATSPDNQEINNLLTFLKIAALTPPFEIQHVVHSNVH